MAGMTFMARVRRGGLTDSTSRWWRHQPRWFKVLAAIGLFVLAVLLPYIPDVPVLSTIFDTPGSDFASVLFYPVACYVMVAIGLNIVVGQAGLLDLGYVAFFAIGAYTSAVLGSGHGSWPWLLTVPAGVAVADDHDHAVGPFVDQRQRFGDGVVRAEGDRGLVDRMARLDVRHDVSEHLDGHVLGQDGHAHRRQVQRPGPRVLRGLHR